MPLGDNGIHISLNEPKDRHSGQRNRMAESKGEGPAHLETAVDFLLKPAFDEGKQTYVIPSATKERGRGGFKRHLTKNHQNSTRVGCESRVGSIPS